MNKKTILVLKTGLFDVDPVLEASTKKIPSTRTISLLDADRYLPSAWDKVLEEILSADQILTI